MPLYEYACEKCGHRFEKIQKFSDALETVCPKCGGVVRKMMSSPAIQFKGSGWYITDYARKKDESGGAAKSDGAKTDSQKTETKTESVKTETKTETAKPEKPAPAKTD